MLDWEFDDLVRDVQEGIEIFSEVCEPFDLISICSDEFESAFEDEEIAEITVIVSMFYAQSKFLFMKKFDYNLLENTIKKYNEINKNIVTMHQQKKLEEMIDFYNENIHKIKLWGRDKERREIYH